MMHLTANGQGREGTEWAAVEGLPGIPRAAVVVMRNGDVVARCLHGAVLLGPSNRLEIVRRGE